MTRLGNAATLAAAKLAGLALYPTSNDALTSFWFLAADEDMQNLLKNVPAALGREVLEILAEGTNVRIERIISHGQASPADYWYDQAQAEWVAVLQGRAELLFEGDDAPVSMQAGDYLLIEAGRRHRVAATAPDQPTIWLAVFFDEKK